MEKSKDAGQRDTELQMQISELKSELRNLTSEKEKLCMLHEERLKGVMDVNLRLEQKIEEILQELNKKKALILELEISKQELREKNSKFSEKLTELEETLIKTDSALARSNSEIEKFRYAEQEGLLITQKQKEGLEIN